MKEFLEKLSQLGAKTSVTDAPITIELTLNGYMYKIQGTLTGTSEMIPEESTTMYVPCALHDEDFMNDISTKLLANSKKGAPIDFTNEALSKTFEQMNTEEQPTTEPDEKVQ